MQDTKLANAAAWSNLGAANEEEDEQKGAEEEEDNGDGLWNTFQSRDDIEREKVRLCKVCISAHRGLLLQLGQSVRLIF